MRALVPAAAILHHAIQGEHYTVMDGDIACAVSRDGPTLRAMRRYVGETGGPAGLTPALPLRTELGVLGEDASRYAQAYATAVMGEEPLAMRLRATVPDDASLPGWRLVLAFGATSAALLAAVLSPLLSARLQVRSAERELVRLAARRGEAARVAHDLDAVTAALGDVAAFHTRRVPATRILSEITSALPQESALTQLRADSAGVSATVLGANAATAVHALDSLTRLGSLAVAGAITRETLGGRELERVVVHIAATASDRRAPCGEAGKPREPARTGGGDP